MLFLSYFHSLSSLCTYTLARSEILLLCCTICLFLTNSGYQHPLILHLLKLVLSSCPTDVCLCSSNPTVLSQSIVFILFYKYYALFYYKFDCLLFLFSCKRLCAPLEKRQTKHIITALFTMACYQSLSFPAEKGYDFFSLPFVLGDSSGAGVAS